MSKPTRNTKKGKKPIGWIALPWKAEIMKDVKVTVITKP